MPRDGRCTVERAEVVLQLAVRVVRDVEILAEARHLLRGRDGAAADRGDKYGGQVDAEQRTAEGVGHEDGALGGLERRVARIWHGRARQ